MASRDERPAVQPLRQRQWHQAWRPVARRAAIDTIRHVFLEIDQDGPRLLAAIASRRNLPPPSYVIESSPNRLHALWRVSAFTTDGVERLQKHLAHELGTDPAATPCSQTTRVPGYRYLKSPVVRTCRITLISHGLTYAAVTQSRKDGARQRRPNASSFSPGASLFVRCPTFDGVKANGAASRSKDVRRA